MRDVLATVGVPPGTATAPPLTRICPAALRLIVTLLSRLSPNVESTPLLKEPTTARVEKSPPAATPLTGSVVGASEGAARGPMIEAPGPGKVDSPPAGGSKSIG